MSEEPVDSSAERWMKISEDMTREFSNFAALLEGQVVHLRGNGWTDEQAREIIMKMVTGK